MKLTARWNGPWPDIGDYLMSQVRPRNAYRISAVREVGSRLELTVDVIPPADVPDGATVHAWRWDPRTKVGAAWSGA